METNTNTKVSFSRALLNKEFNFFIYSTDDESGIGL